MQAFLVRVLIYILIASSLISCSGYNKLLKEGTREEKLEGARKYYSKKDYMRAQPLLEDLMGLYFGLEEREEIFLKLAYTHYGLSEYLIAGYHFRTFANNYPVSEHREEATYMSAVCDYHKSLAYELDQTNTKMAIRSLQGFINKYPNSSYVDDCNNRMDELRKRLLVKAYNSAKLYYQLGQYNAAIVACTNALEDYPDIINRDELHYLIADAAFIYASNSVTSSQEERYQSCVQACDEYLKNFDSNNSYYNRVLRIKEQSTAALKELAEAEETTPNNNKS